MEGSFTWTVSDDKRGMLKMSWKHGESFSSSFFRRGNHLWQLSLCPLGDTEAKREVVIHLVRMRAGQRMTVEGQIILSSPGARDWAFTLDHTFSENDTYVRIPLYQSLNEMYRYYPPHQDFRVTCTFDVVGLFDASSSAHGSALSLASTAMTSPTTPLQSTAGDNLSSCLERLLRKGRFSDTLLLCADQRKLRAHRAVLVARCTKFAELLRRKRSTTLHLEHVDGEVMEELLFHAYTGRTSSSPLGHQMARELWRAARELGCRELQRLCAERLRSVDSVLDLVVLAEEEGDEELGEEALRFLSEHFAQIRRTERWKSFVGEQPQLVVKVLSAIVEQGC